MDKWEAIWQLSRKIKELREAGFIVKVGYGVAGGDTIDTITDENEDNVIVIY